MKKDREFFLCGDCKWFRKFPPDKNSVPGYGSCESPTRLNNPGGADNWVYYRLYCFIPGAMFEAKDDAPNR